MSAWEGSAMQAAQQQAAASQARAMQQYTGMQSATTSPRPLLELRNEMRQRFEVVSEKARVLAKELSAAEDERDALARMLEADAPREREHAGGE